MYCNNCGTKISNDDAFCPSCGARIIPAQPPVTVVRDNQPINPAPVQPPVQTYAPPPPVYAPPPPPVHAPATEKSNTVGIVGFVLAFFMPLAGLICSIIGYKNAKKGLADNKGLALAGIIISALELGSGIAIGLIYAFMYFMLIIGIAGSGGFYSVLPALIGGLLI